MGQRENAGENRAKSLDPDGGENMTLQTLGGSADYAAIGSLGDSI